MDLTNEIPEAMSRPGNILIQCLNGYKCILNDNPDRFYDVVFYPGGFCQSYPLSKAGTPGKKCLRLWVDDSSLRSNLQHVKRISKYFAENWVEYVVNYEYYESALRLNDGTIIPGVVMDWVEGETLQSYVKSNYRQSSKILNVAKEFLTMERYLDKNGFAHGDLSGDNIIVTKTGNLILIDYDSFFISNINQNVEQSTAGIACYQHPGRKSNKYITNSMDNFSQLVIYCSLLAIARHPSVFDPNAEKGLLFQEDDMANVNSFISSSICRELHSFKDEELDHYLKVIETALRGPFNNVPSLLHSIYQHKEQPLSLLPYCRVCGTRFSSSDQLFCYLCGNKREQSIKQTPPKDNVRYSTLERLLGLSRKQCDSCGYISTQDNNYCGNCGKPYESWNEKEVTYLGTKAAIDEIRNKYEKEPTLSTGFNVLWKAIKNLF